VNRDDPSLEPRPNVPVLGLARCGCDVRAGAADRLIWRGRRRTPPAESISRHGAAIAIALTFSFYGLWFLALRLLLRLRYDRPFWRSLAWVGRPAAFGTAPPGDFCWPWRRLCWYGPEDSESKTPLEELLKTAPPFC